MRVMRRIRSRASEAKRRQILGPGVYMIFQSSRASKVLFRTKFILKLCSHKSNLQMILLAYALSSCSEHDRLIGDGKKFDDRTKPTKEQLGCSGKRSQTAIGIDRSIMVESPWKTASMLIEVARTGMSFSQSAKACSTFCQCSPCRFMARRTLGALSSPSRRLIADAVRLD